MASELTKTKQQLQAKQEELAAIQSQPPANPMLRSRGKDPYPSGPILQRKFSSEEAPVMIKALRELTEASQKNMTLSIPNELFVFDPMQNRHPNWIEVIKKEGFDAAIDRLSKFKTEAQAGAAETQGVISANPYYASDLHRILGRPSFFEMAAAAESYIQGLKELKSMNVEIPLAVIGMSLNERMEGLAVVVRDFSRWNQTFTQQRSPSARQELENYI
jgi:hypothetical protein